MYDSKNITKSNLYVFSSVGIKQCAKFGADPISHESGRGLNNNGLEENWPTRKKDKTTEKSRK